LRQFVWHDTDSPLHRLNPLTKLALTVPVAAIASLSDQPLTPVLVAGLAVVATRLFGNIPWPSILRPLALSSVLGFGMMWTGVLFYAGPGSEPGAPAIRLGPIEVPVAAIVYGLTIAARLLAIFAASLLFVLTTDPVDFVLALIQQARLPHRVGYGVFAAYRFVPLVAEELDNIRAAHQIRGVSGEGGLRGRVRQTFSYAIPLLAISVRRAERVALAMDARGFGALPERTFFRRTYLRRADLIFTVAALVLLTVAVGASRALWPAI